ncbi:protein FAM246C-like [Schistocerca cancellata]|uniref:protein FAM246C-like n=1 Tax=Schistocerca cancellata TaxID=274614 RepID=UPI0021186035|nr:protein FAM246C-like [Schistocerca cancellata]
MADHIKPDGWKIGNLWRNTSAEQVPPPPPPPPVSAGGFRRGADKSTGRQAGRVTGSEVARPSARMRGVVTLSGAPALVAPAVDYLPPCGAARVCTNERPTHNRRGEERMGSSAASPPPAEPLNWQAGTAASGRLEAAGAGAGEATTPHWTRMPSPAPRPTAGCVACCRRRRPLLPTTGKAPPVDVTRTASRGLRG